MTKQKSGAHTVPLFCLTLTLGKSANRQPLK